MTPLPSRRAFTLSLAGAAAAPLLMSRVTRAQQAVPVIGYLNSSLPGDVHDPLRALRDALKEHGYVEGENLAIEYCWGENDPKRLATLAAHLADRRVNVIATSSAPASVAAAKATSTIPIVFVVPEDPVRLGLVSSLARPGGNATGINFFSAELAAKRLELLRALLPNATRMAALINPAEPTIAAANRRDVEAAASAMGLQVQTLHASSIAQIETAFEALARERPDALFISGGPFFANRRVQLAQLAARHAVPAIHSGRQYPEVGGLMSYGASLTDAHRQVGVYVGRILKGAKPSDLPVVQSTKFELVINVTTARMLDLTVPASLLAIADVVIE